MVEIVIVVGAVVVVGNGSGGGGTVTFVAVVISCLDITYKRFYIVASKKAGQSIR